MALSGPKAGCERCKGCQLAVNVAAGAVIHEGAILMADANGFALPADDATGAGLAILGVALECADNTGGADGDLRIAYSFGGVVEVAADASITAANVGEMVFALDDETIAGTAATTNALSVGRLVEVNENGKFFVLLSPSNPAAP